MDKNISDSFLNCKRFARVSSSVQRRFLKIGKAADTPRMTSRRAAEAIAARLQRRAATGFDSSLLSYGSCTASDGPDHRARSEAMRSELPACRLRQNCARSGLYRPGKPTYNMADCELFVPVAQLDRALASGAKGCASESHRGYWRFNPSHRPSAGFSFPS